MLRPLPGISSLSLILPSNVPGLFTFIFVQTSPYFLTALVLGTAISRVGLRIKIGHSAHSHTPFKAGSRVECLRNISRYQNMCCLFCIDRWMVGWFLTLQQ